jgi:hypothetical protein
MMITYVQFLNKEHLLNGGPVIGNKIRKYLKNNTNMNVVNIIIAKTV